MNEMTCQDARNLFDAHLDGELSANLETELGAHLVECPSCRRELALMEVAGHVIRVDQDEPQLSDSFSDRLLACIELDQPSPSVIRFRSVTRWIVGGVAAAACLLAAVGWFSGRSPIVAGQKELVEESATSESAVTTGSSNNSAAKWEQPGRDPLPRELDSHDWNEMTIMQLMDALGLDKKKSQSEADQPSTQEDPFLNSSITADDSEIEDF